MLHRGFLILKPDGVPHLLALLDHDRHSSYLKTKPGKTTLANAVLSASDKNAWVWLLCQVYQKHHYCNYCIIPNDEEFTVHVASIGPEYGQNHRMRRPCPIDLKPSAKSLSG